MDNAQLKPSQMTNLVIKFYTKPVPKGRPRFSFKARRVYTDAKTSKDEKSLQIEMLKYLSQVPTNVSHVEVMVSFSYKGKPGPKTTRPDLDNNIKQILDAGNGILWRDDALVTKITAEKIWHPSESHTTLSVFYWESDK